MQVTIDQIQKTDIIQVIHLSNDIMIGVVYVMIIYDDEVEIVKMVMDDDTL
jgi:hypothetical protein